VTGIILTTDEQLRALIREELRTALGEARGADLLSTEEAARVAGVTPKTVRDWIRAGAVPASRRGRRHVVKRADLMAYLSGSRKAHDGRALGLVASPE